MSLKYKTTLLLSPLALLPFGSQHADAAPLTMRNAPPVAPSWAGFYGGLNFGLNADQSKITGFAPAANTTYCFAAAADCSATNSQSTVGFLGGFQLGYNFQAGHVVYGFESDIDFSTARKTTTGANGFGAGNWTVKSGIESLSTFRGRLGYAFDNSLIYGTGGLAIAKTAHSFQGADSVFGSSPYSFANAGWRTGYVLGGGVEFKLSGKWSVKGEALYYDLGKVDLASTLNNGGTYAFGATDHITGTVARIGLNYQFH